MFVCVSQIRIYRLSKENPPEQSHYYLSQYILIFQDISFLFMALLTHFKQGPACIPTVPDCVPDNCCYCMNIVITVVLVFCTREASMAKIYKTSNICLKKLSSVLDCLSWVCLGPAVSPYDLHLIRFTSGQVFSEGHLPCFYRPDVKDLRVSRVLND